ncbi:MAG: chitobiase/beta-hexosaminidase C-terminal domain-containing protein [Armatimonadetes bacterium]|nr:chitobiase/beta-hexosaminidase C-terminal domain-containing protein [Armatimonadota bacterium]
MSQPYMPMFGKNVGGGNIPDDTYDWPNGKVATYIVDGNSYVQWEAPTDMVVNVTGGIWTAGRYFDVDSRRSLLTLLIDRADNGYDPFVSPDWIKPNTTVPLWYDDGSGITATAADQHTFAEIMGPDAGMFQGLQVTRGDRIAAYFYSDPSAFAEGLNGMDFVITGSALTAPPSFSPDGGLYFAPQNVAMSSSTPGATIRYTTDGSDPSPTHGTVYSSAVLVSASMTLKAIAYTGTGESTIKSADYVIAIPTSVTIGEAKSLSDMSAADLSSVVVSASFADRWYVQSLDRSAGIMVSGPIPGGFSVGSVADIRGLLKTDTDTAERYVQPVEVTDTTNKADVWPLIVTNKTLGGGPMGLQAGVNGGSGLNNIGTPVKTTGRVTLVETDHFVLDDGSGVNVKVIGSPPVAENSYITVTGISSCEKDGSGNVLRLIRATDFLPVKPAIAYSTHLGGKQIWIRASSFVRRSADGGSPNFVEDPIAVPNTKSGAAFYFKRQVTSSALEQLDWWVQYDIPQMGEFGAPFDLNGTWRFWARTSQNSWNANDADWVVVNGDPNDLSKSSPTNADWFNALWVNKDNARANSTQRVLNNIANAGFTAYTFGWFSSENLSTARAKAFGVIDDKVSFRLYEREASFTNALIDVICWSSDPTYVPSDGDLDAVTGW